MKKIVQIIPTFCMGGAEIMCENLINELLKTDVNVIAVSLYDKKTPITDRLESKGVDVRYLGKRKGLDLSMISKLKTIFKQEKPDVVHSHSNAMQYVVPAALMAKVKKKIHTVHSMASKELGKPAKIAAKFFYRYCGVTPVALSDVIRDSVVDLYKLPRENIPVVFNGTDLAKCILKTDYAYGDVFTFLHIGRFAPEKNHAMLLRAFKTFHSRYPNAKLQLIGDGEKRGEMEKYVTDNCLTDSVEFLGIQSDVHTFLQLADVFVLPSIYEGIPLTLTEAMGTGLPIIATRVGGIPDMLVNEESALLIDVDEQALVDAFEEMYFDKELRNSLGINALRRAKVFSSTEMKNKYLALYTG